MNLNKAYSRVGAPDTNPKHSRLSYCARFKQSCLGRTHLAGQVHHATRRIYHVSSRLMNASLVRRKNTRRVPSRLHTVGYLVGLSSLRLRLHDTSNPNLSPPERSGSVPPQFKNVPSHPKKQLVRNFSHISTPRRSSYLPGEHPCNDVIRRSGRDNTAARSRASKILRAAILAFATEPDLQLA